MTALSKNRTARLAQGLAAAAKASDSRFTRVAAAQRAVQHLENGGLVATEALTEEERAGLDYSKQGNTEMYTADNLQRREALKQDPLVRDAIAQWWRFMQAVEAGGKGGQKVEDTLAERFELQRDAFIQMSLKLQRVLIQDFEESEALITAQADWEEDCMGRDAMRYDAFFASIFELADLWSDDIDAASYAKFLGMLLKAVAAPGWPPRAFKPDAHIGYSGYSGDNVDAIGEAALPQQDGRGEVARLMEEYAAIKAGKGAGGKGVSGRGRAEGMTETRAARAQREREMEERALREAQVGHKARWRGRASLMAARGPDNGPSAIAAQLEALREAMPAWMADGALSRRQARWARASFTRGAGEGEGGEAEGTPASGGSVAAAALQAALAQRDMGKREQLAAVAAAAGGGRDRRNMQGYIEALRRLEREEATVSATAVSMDVAADVKTDGAGGTQPHLPSHMAKLLKRQRRGNKGGGSGSPAPQIPNASGRHTQLLGANMLEAVAAYHEATRRLRQDDAAGSPNTRRPNRVVAAGTIAPRGAARWYHAPRTTSDMPTLLPSELLRAPTPARPPLGPAATSPHMSESNSNAVHLSGASASASGSGGLEWSTGEVVALVYGHSLFGADWAAIAREFKFPAWKRPADLAAKFSALCASGLVGAATGVLHVGGGRVGGARAERPLYNELRLEDEAGAAKGAPPAAALRAAWRGEAFVRACANGGRTPVRRTGFDARAARRWGRPLLDGLEVSLGERSLSPDGLPIGQRHMHVRIPLPRVLEPEPVAFKGHDPCSLPPALAAAAAYGARREDAYAAPVDHGAVGAREPLMECVAAWADWDDALVALEEQRSGKATSGNACGGGVGLEGDGSLNPKSRATGSIARFGLHAEFGSTPSPEPQSQPRAMASIAEQDEDGAGGDDGAGDVAPQQAAQGRQSASQSLASRLMERGFVPMGPRVARVPDTAASGGGAVDWSLLDSEELDEMPRLNSPVNSKRPLPPIRAGGAN